jgi:alpha-L-rhamnosidase
MSPKPVGDLKYVNAEYNSIRGLIKSNWKKDKNSFTWEITIPVGSTALITLPTGYNIGKINKMSVAGKLETISTENRIKLGSGSYKIISQGKMP